MGVNGNTRSKLFVNGVLVSSVSTAGILNPGKFEDFEILWKNDWVAVTHQTSMFVHQVSNPVAVRFIGVGTR